jgi:hypothetical protein
MSLDTLLITSVFVILLVYAMRNIMTDPNINPPQYRLPSKSELYVTQPYVYTGPITTPPPHIANNYIDQIRAYNNVSFNSTNYNNEFSGTCKTTSDCEPGLMCTSNDSVNYSCQRLIITSPCGLSVCDGDNPNIGIPGNLGDSCGGNTVGIPANTCNSPLLCMSNISSISNSNGQVTSDTSAFLNTASGICSLITT